MAFPPPLCLTQWISILNVDAYHQAIMLELYNIIISYSFSPLDNLCSAWSNNLNMVIGPASGSPGYYSQRPLWISVSVIYPDINPNGDKCRLVAVTLADMFLTLSGLVSVLEVSHIINTIYNNDVTYCMFSYYCATLTTSPHPWLPCLLSSSLTVHNHLFFLTCSLFHPTNKE